MVYLSSGVLLELVHFKLVSLHPFFYSPDSPISEDPSIRHGVCGDNWLDLQYQEP